MSPPPQNKGNHQWGMKGSPSCPPRGKWAASCNSKLERLRGHEDMQRWSPVRPARRGRVLPYWSTIKSFVSPCNLLPGNQNILVGSTGLSFATRGSWPTQWWLPQDWKGQRDCQFHRGQRSASSPARPCEATKGQAWSRKTGIVWLKQETGWERHCCRVDQQPHLHCSGWRPHTAEGRKGHGEGKALPTGEILSGFCEPQSLCKSQAKKRARELGIGF